MFGKGVFLAEENLLREIIRSVDKKIDYSAREGEGNKITLHLKLRNHEGDVMLDLEDLQTAKQDQIRRHQIRQKIKARCDHLDSSRYGADILWPAIGADIENRAEARTDGAARLEPQRTATLIAHKLGYVVLLFGR
jgi:hypothetical protein